MISVLNQGCAANFGDGEKIARILSKNHEVRFNLPEAGEGSAPEAIYLNVCTVKGNAGAIKLLRHVLDEFPGSKIYITGCAPKDLREEVARITNKVTFTSLAEIVSRNANAENEKEIPAQGGDDNGRHTLRESPFVGIVNIEEGCLDACSFCSTHLVKGRLHSFSQAHIVEQVSSLVHDGCQEIQLTGQDCACYGFDTGTNLAELVQAILVKVPGKYKIRLGMGNPRHMATYLEPLLDCFTDDRLYQFIHLPVQSGSDSVLRAMNRKHSVEDYVKLANAFTERFDRFTLSTDIIVGHPGETQEDFEQTLRLVQQTRPTVCNITRYVARPGTAAARNDSIPDTVKHERSATLFETFRQIAEENNCHWIGTRETVFIEKPGYREGTSIARNRAYRPVAIPGNLAAGQEVQVRITGAEPFALIAEME